MTYNRPAGPEQAPRGFVSYVPEDRLMVQRLLRDLNPIAERGLATEFWSDLNLSPGDDWASAVDWEIARSDVFLMCISSDYMASQYRYEWERPRIWRRVESVGGLIIPVILRTCAWWGVVDDFPAVPTKRGRIKPITEWQPIDDGYARAAWQIQVELQEYQGLPTPPDGPDDVLPSGKLPPLANYVYDGPHVLSEEAIERAINAVLGRRPTQ